ncbi:MAG: glycosyltransferase family 2 protein [Sulfurospirillaceae bacterium]|nr:glycosyltransferase family 2 protein [Sulfurospirillaceae bacterium]
MKLLTLALPVYNGETCIGLTLESIDKALEALSSQEKQIVEILVSDNKSIDGTSQVIKKFINQDLDINYYCNEINIGYDANIDALVERSSGKYVWFLGCGEQIKSNALHRLIEQLNVEQEYTNILVDFDIYDEQKQELTESRVFDFDNDILIESKNDFPVDKYGTAVSSNVINKNKWQQITKNKLVVDGWCHVERILDMIALEDNSKTLLLTMPFFTLFREKNGWWTKSNSYLLLLVMLHIQVIESMLNKGYKKEIVQILKLKQSRLTLLMSIVQSKEYGMKLDYKVFFNMVKLFKYDYFFWIVTVPLLLIPQKLIFIPRSIFKLYKTIKSSIK